VIYLDNNATTQPSLRVVKAMLPYLRDCYFNPSAATAAYTGADKARQGAAAAMAKLINAEDPDCFTFTSGATEANNWVLASVQRGVVVISAIEHPSVAEPALSARSAHKVIPVDRNGILDLDALRAGLDKEVGLVSIVAANNETGVLQPVSTIGRLVRTLAPSALFHVDATQMVGKLPVDLQGEWEDVDALSFSAHKFHGPKGVGGLYLRPGIELPPLLRGGAQENGRRAGTTNTPALAGLAAAAASWEPATASAVRRMRDQFEIALLEQFPHAVIHSVNAPRLPNTSCFSLPNVVGEELATKLAAQGIIVGTGSACSSGATHPPKTLLAMGVDYDVARAALRFSCSVDNLNEDIAALLNACREFQEFGWNMKAAGGNTAQNESPAFEKCPQAWIEERDIEGRSFEKTTWIPLVAEEVELLRGRYGTLGHRKACRYIDSVIVPLDLQAEFKEVDWQSVSRNWPDFAWADDKRFVPPGCHGEDPRVLYPVIQRSFATGEPKQWDLLQELEVGLGLYRQGDTWIRPEENDVEVAKLERDADGKPKALLIRAVHLRDYLCAKKASLLLTMSSVRYATEESFPELSWDSDRQERRFAHGEWEGTRADIHEGGKPYGMETAVLHMWRESVNPNEDVPEMPHPAAETAAKTESFTVKAEGRKLSTLCGTIRLKHWIPPAAKSPRIRSDEVESPVPFQVENQEQKSLAGNALKKYRGWLWFKPSVIGHLLGQPKSCIKWFTQDTGEVGPAANQLLHFGINRIGLINVLGYEMGQLPEWVQKMWVTHNVGPEGALSQELHMAQNLARPANTTAPESILWQNLQLLQKRSTLAYGQPLLRQMPHDSEFFRMIHRFYCDSFEDVCELCKELHRIVCEPIDIGLLNSKIDAANAEAANKQKLRQIKRLALWLNTLKLDGRKITQALAGVADLRQGDAHAKSSELRESLKLFGIPPDCTDYQTMCCEIIGQVANSIGAVANAVPAKSGG